MYYYNLKDLLTRGVYIYTLDDAKERIDYGVANGKLTFEQAAELLEIAEALATEAPLTEQVEKLKERVNELTEIVGALGVTPKEEPGEDELTEIAE